MVVNFRVLGIFSKKNMLYAISIIIHQEQNTVYVEKAIKGKNDKILKQILNAKIKPFWDSIVYDEYFDDTSFKNELEKLIPRYTNQRINNPPLGYCERLINSKIFHTNLNLNNKLLQDIENFDNLKGDLDNILNNHMFLACLIMLCGATHNYYQIDTSSNVRNNRKLRSSYLSGYTSDNKNDSDLVAELMRSY